MKKILIMIYAALLVLGSAVGHTARADEYGPGPYETVTEVYDDLFTPEELDDLLAPIALYPDPLIAQILPAATFVDEIDEAERYVSMYGTAGIDNQPWDVSVRALAYYPDVLAMMDSKYDWTVSLGQAYVNQPQDVMDAIQRLRQDARALGSLVSTAQQTVIIEDGIIRIVPAQAEVIYVPVYDPAVIYVESPPPYGFITFGIGFRIGVWLNRDCDWRGHRVFYHGWKGGGWINRARPHVQVRNPVYVNKTYTVVNVNRRVVQRDTVRYRETIRNDVQKNRARIGRPVTPPRDGRTRDRVDKPPVQSRPAPVVGRPTESPDRRTRDKVEKPPVQPGPAPVIGRPTESPDRRTRDKVEKPPAPVVSRPAESPDRKDNYRGRETKGTQPAPYSGYGGYGSGKEIKTYRERGQSSRENVRQNTPQQAPGKSERPAPAPSVGKQPSPSPRQSAPAGGGGGLQRQPR